jgi:arylsulfatase A-like enzyme
MRGRSRFVLALVVVLIAVLLQAVPRHHAAADTAPCLASGSRCNVLIVETDDQSLDSMINPNTGDNRVSYMPLLGSRIANEAGWYSFTQARTQDPLCGPSRWGQLLGQTSIHHTLTCNDPTLACSNAGYKKNINRTYLQALHNVGYWNSWVGKFLNWYPCSWQKNSTTKKYLVPSGVDDWHGKGGNGTAFDGNYTLIESNTGANASAVLYPKVAGDSDYGPYVYRNKTLAAIDRCAALQPPPTTTTTTTAATTTIAEETTTVPDETTTVPDDTTTVPDETTTVPDTTTTTVPDTTTTTVPTANTQPCLWTYMTSAGHGPGTPPSDYNASQVVPVPAHYPSYNEGCTNGVDKSIADKPSFAKAHVFCDSMKLWSRNKNQKPLQAEDRSLEAIINRLKADGLYDSTIIVFTSDHGFSYNENNHITKESPYEPSMRVPFYIHVPGAPGGRIDSLVYLPDLAATLYDVSGATALVPTDGVSLLPLLRGEVASVHPDGVLGSHLNTGTQVDVKPWYAWYQDCSVVAPADCYVIIRYKTGGEEELYDLTTDPYELRNLLPNRVTGYAGVPGYDSSNPLVAGLETTLTQHIAAGV